MRSGPVEHDSMAQDAVDQEPVRIHMAFGESGDGGNLVRNAA
jgi:hypothetical protein